MKSPGHSKTSGSGKGSKTPGSAGSKGKGSKGAGKSTGHKSGHFPSAKQLSSEYKADARREEADSRREYADAARRRKEAQHYEAEAARDKKEGYSASAKYDLAKARRETAEAARDQAKARKHAAKARLDQAKSRRAGLALPGGRPGGWILGGNDWHSGCAAVALANHLLAATGRRVSERDIVALYEHTEGADEAGASIWATLEAAAKWGLADRFPIWKEADGPEADAPAAHELGHPDRRRGADHLLHRGAHPDALILDLDLAPGDWGTPGGQHAVLYAGDRVVSWGRQISVTPQFLDARTAAAWQIRWSGNRALSARTQAGGDAL